MIRDWNFIGFEYSKLA